LIPLPSGPAITGATITPSATIWTTLYAAILHVSIWSYILATWDVIPESCYLLFRAGIFVKRKMFNRSPDDNRSVTRNMEWLGRSCFLSFRIWPLSMCTHFAVSNRKFRVQLH
jgi:hypothetical protein